MAQTVNSMPAMWDTQVRSLGWEDFPGEWNGNPFQYSCLENSMDRNQASYSWWGHKESDTTELLTHTQHSSQVCTTLLIGEPIEILNSIQFCAENKRYVQLYVNSEQIHRFWNMREYKFSFFLFFTAPWSCKERNLVISHPAHRSQQF